MDPILPVFSYCGILGDYFGPFRGPSSNVAIPDSSSLLQNQEPQMWACILLVATNLGDAFGAVAELLGCSS